MTKARQNADNFAADITGVTAGTGITGGGTSGAVTVTLDGDAVIAPTIFTTEGDLIVGDATGVPVRLPVGTAGQILTSDGDTVSFVTPSGASQSFTLLNAGGTALTGAATVTVSGISGINQLLIFVNQASSVNAFSMMSLRFNADSGANYDHALIVINSISTYSSTILNTFNAVGSTQIDLGMMSNNVNSTVNGSMMVYGCNSTDKKIFQGMGTGNQSAAGHRAVFGGGVYHGASTISSISVVSSSGNLDNGTVFVYGST